MKFQDCTLNWKIGKQLRKEGMEKHFSTVPEERILLCLCHWPTTLWAPGTGSVERVFSVDWRGLSMLPPSHEWGFACWGPLAYVVTRIHQTWIYFYGLIIMQKIYLCVHSELMAHTHTNQSVLETWDIHEWMYHLQAPRLYFCRQSHETRCLADMGKCVLLAPGSTVSASLLCFNQLLKWLLLLF